MCCGSQRNARNMIGQPWGKFSFEKGEAALRHERKFPVPEAVTNYSSSCTTFFFVTSNSGERVLTESAAFKGIRDIQFTAMVGVNTVVPQGSMLSGGSWSQKPSKDQSLQEALAFSVLTCLTQQHTSVGVHASCALALCCSSSRRSCRGCILAQQ